MLFEPHPDSGFKLVPCSKKRAGSLLMSLPIRSFPADMRGMLAERFRPSRAVRAEARDDGSIIVYLNVDEGTP